MTRQTNKQTDKYMELPLFTRFFDGLRTGQLRYPPLSNVHFLYSYSSYQIGAL